ncbi:MAG: MnhB domain-containing protein [Solirubrobacteraceae bacterium]
MRPRARLWLFAVSAALLGFLLVDGLAGLPDFGHYHGPYGIVLAHVAVPQRKATDIVNSITYDYRGLDTMGEEFILFASAIGLVIVLRQMRGERRDEQRKEQEPADPADRRHGETSVALRALGLALVGPVLVLGVYFATQGQLTPGGGFQGGVILAAALILVYLAGRYLAVARVRPIPVVELAEGLGAAGYAAIGVGGLIAGAQFLLNFLPLGAPGNLLSGGTIALLSAVVGLEVSGAFTLIFAEFIDQRLLTGGRR